MAKKHKNLENIKIQWNGDLSKSSDSSAQSAPDNIDITWGGYKPCWYGGDYSNCVVEDMYFEDFDFAAAHPETGLNTVELPDGALSINDIIGWGSVGRSDIQTAVTSIIMSGCSAPNDTAHQGCTPAPKTTYTWGDVSFVMEIADAIDGVGTASRRAREARLNQFEQEKKKRLVRLICRVKGEKVYDEEKEMSDTYIKLEDAELVINEVLGKMRVENANVL